MEVRPPDPPDPPDRRVRPPSPDQMDLSPPVFTQTGSKRRLDDDIAPEPPKKPNVEPNPAFYSVPSDSPTSYTDSDKGPFIVHVSHTENELSSGISIRPIKFGQFLVKNNIKNIKNDGVKKIGRNRISVEFKSGTDANNFLENRILSVHKYTAVIPNYNISRMGVVRGIPLDTSMQELVEVTKIPNGCGAILKARRFNRKLSVDGKATWAPTQSVVLTFQGQVLPERVFIYHNSISIEPYQLPTIQCFNCCRFGHTKSQCRSKPRCFRCAQSHSGDNCHVNEKDATCIYCSANHFANDKSCPEQIRQQNIKSCMSQDNISYQEAAARFKQSKMSYSDMLKSTPNHSSSLSQQSMTSNSNTVTSYKKTVSLPSRSRPSLGKSFDREAHNAIIYTPASSMPNGCALNSSHTNVSNRTCINTSNENLSPTPNDNLLDCLCGLIFNILSRYDDVPLPSNVAQRINQLHSLINKNGEFNSMEL